MALSRRLSGARPAGKLYDFISVTRDQKYCGVVTIKDLLEKTMEVEVSNARHLNPLSGLPGNLLIERNLEKCIASEGPYTVLYVDIDNFKAYNDVYGFGNGDRVIRFVAGLLEKAVEDGTFIGHVGGDDFVAVLHTYEAEDLCRTIIGRFDAGIRVFYSPEDLCRGYVLAKNRKGADENYQIMTLSVAGVSNRSRRFEDITALAEHASVIKRECKLKWESCYIID